MDRITVDQWISTFKENLQDGYTMTEWMAALEMVYYYILSATKTDYLENSVQLSRLMDPRDLIGKYFDVANVFRIRMIKYADDHNLVA